MDRVVVYQSELEILSASVMERPDIETGGELFGFWTSQGDPVVLYAIGPGPKANHQVSFFQQDVAYLTEIGHELVGQYGLQHIGEWHSHHRLGLPHPSGHDAETIVSTLRERDLSRFLLCIASWDVDGKLQFNAFGFERAATNVQTYLDWDVKAGVSPFRMRRDQDVRYQTI